MSTRFPRCTQNPPTSSDPCCNTFFEPLGLLTSHRPPGTPLSVHSPATRWSYEKARVCHSSTQNLPVASSLVEGECSGPSEAPDSSLPVTFHSLLSSGSLPLTCCFLGCFSNVPVLESLAQNLQQLPISLRGKPSSFSGR